MGGGMGVVLEMGAMATVWPWVGESGAARGRKEAARWCAGVLVNTPPPAYSYTTRRRRVGRICNGAGWIAKRSSEIAYSGKMRAAQWRTDLGGGGGFRMGNALDTTSMRTSFGRAVVDDKGWLRRWRGICL